MEKIKDIELNSDLLEDSEALKLEGEEPIKSKKDYVYKKFKFEENPKYQKFINGLNKFLYSDFYLIALAAVIFLFWLIGYYCNGAEIGGAIIIVLFASFVLITREDATPLIPIIFMCSAMFPIEINPATYGLAFIGLAPLPIAIVFHVIRYRKKFKIGKQFFPLLAVTIALLLGGVGTISAYNYGLGIAWILLLGVAILVLYFIFYNYSRPSDEIDLKKFLAKILMYTALLITIEVFVYYMRNPEQITHLNGRVSLGWCIGNNFACIMCLLLPGTCYLAVKSKLSWLYTALLALQYVGILLSLSRGGILFSFIALPFLLGFMIYSSKAYRNGILIAIAVVVGIFIIICGVFWDKFSALILAIINDNFSDTGDVITNGRTALYIEAWECFKTNPIFGVGIGYRGYIYKMEKMPMYWFHSTLFQIVGSLGLVGIAAYVYMYVIRYGFIIVKKDIFNVFVFIGLLAFEGYSMIDTGTFVPMPTMIMVMFIVMFLEFINKKNNREWQFENDREGNLLVIKPQLGVIKKKIKKIEGKISHGGNLVIEKNDEGSVNSSGKKLDEQKAPKSKDEKEQDKE